MTRAESPPGLETTAAYVAPAGIEARRHERASLATEVHLTSASNIYTGLADNVSEGGLFVATTEFLPRGTVIDLAFSLPDGGPPIRTSGVVRWIREDLDEIEEPPGMGVQFVELSEAARARLERFVSHRGTIFYED